MVNIKINLYPVNLEEFRFFWFLIQEFQKLFHKPKPKQLFMKYIALAAALAKAMPVLEGSDDTAFQLPSLQCTASLEPPRKIRRLGGDLENISEQVVTSDSSLNSNDFIFQSQISPAPSTNGPSIFLMRYQSCVSTDQKILGLLNIPPRVAVKSFSVDDYSFFVEKNIAETLGNRSPYIINTYGVFWRDGNNIVMEYGGDDVFHYAYKNLPKIVENESCSRFLMMQIIVAVEYVHSKGLLHNDIKLENFVFKKDALTIKLIDFGTVTHIKATNQFQTIATGWNMNYRSPEIAANLLQNPTEVGFASDWYSVGIILYALIHGCYPYKAPMFQYDDIEFFEFLTNLESGRLFKQTILITQESLLKKSSNSMVDLLISLLRPRQSERLGYSDPLDLLPEAALGAKGSSEIKNSPWFRCVDWAVVQGGNEKEIQAMCEKSSQIPTPKASDSKCCTYLEG